MYFLTKILITSLIVAAISELSRRYSLLAAFLASLPLTSILALVWMYKDGADAGKISTMSYDIFWLVLPSLAFFLVLPWLLKCMGFVPSLLIACAVTALLYGIGFWLYRALLA